MEWRTWSQSTEKRSSAVLYTSQGSQTTGGPMLKCIQETENKFLKNDIIKRFRPIWRREAKCRTELKRTVASDVENRQDDRAKAGRPARTYIQQLCEDTGCSPEDLPEAMNDREEWRERVRDIRASGTTWWWGWWWWWWFRRLFFMSSLLTKCPNVWDLN